MKNRTFFYIITCFVSAGLLWMGLAMGLNLGAYGQTTDALPHLITKLKATTSVEKAVLRADGSLYFSGPSGLNIVNGLEVISQISPPVVHPEHIQDLSDVAIDSQTGLIYSLDRYGDAIHVISDTQILTTLVGAIGHPLQVTVDEDTGEAYVFYVNNDGPNRARAAVLSGTTVVTDIALPSFPGTIQYNPVDGHIYVASNYYVTDNAGEHTEEMLFVLDNHEVITAIAPLDNSANLSIVDMAINPENGDIYILSTQVTYWDRVNPPHSIDLYEAGYKNLRCIMVDPTRELVYVCSWMEGQSYVVVLNKEGIQTAIPVKKWPDSIARDRKHDYIYVAHYDPTNLSVIRGTELITTLNIIGFGTMDVIVDEVNDLIYTANADDASISVFGFDQPTQPLWRRFLPFMAR